MSQSYKTNKKERKKRVVVSLAKEQQVEIEQKVAQRVKDNPEMFSLPESSRTIDDLEDYFIKQNEGTNKILPKEKRRYVVYLRKSTDDEAKQIRSLPDQRVECLELARIIGVTVREEDILEESESAKTSGNRPIFDNMIEGFLLSKYHGLIAWSPDRLSRNMKEAGEIIEMIDLEQIQDLQFKTYQFENTPNGKMLLGILFATSKQYSDKLSVDVSRGITGNVKEGKYQGVVKKGYYADKSTGYFIPDGYNWELLREAVNMRLHQGKTNPEIADFLNASYFSERKDQDEDYRIAKMNKDNVGNLFKDPFYFGLYKYGNKLANLTELYDFLPLITPDEYILLNRDTADNFSEKYAGRATKVNRLDYGLLRNKVICDYCDSIMQFQHQKIFRGKNKGRWLISYYCRNSDCVRRNEAEAIEKYGHKLKSSIRAKYVTAAIEYTLRQCTKKSKEAYKMHIDKLTLKLAQDKAIAQRKLQEAKNELRINTTQFLKYQNFQVEHPDDYKKYHKGKLEHHQNLINTANASIKQNEAELEKLNTSLPTEAEFYELIKSYLLIILSTRDLMEEDAVYNEVVLNLRARDDTVSVVNLNKPYDLLLDLSKIVTGRG
jgi:DNA invertase Pin-like site-specific DNA recombinase